MITYEPNQVQDFANDLNAQWEKCENGEGMECQELDTTLGFCADRCCEFLATLTEWGRDIFAGKVVFDPITEQQWKTELFKLFDRAHRLWRRSAKKEVDCWELGGQVKLEAALWSLSQLKDGWVTPKLAVGPSARLGHLMSPGAAQDAIRMAAALPKLPADWKPTRPEDAKRLEQIQRTP